MGIYRETEQDRINIRNPHVYKNKIAKIELTAKATMDVFEYCKPESFVDELFLKQNLGLQR